MTFYYNQIEYPVIIEKKRIKNLYIRVKEDLNIYITCNILTSNQKIESLIKENHQAICNMIEVQKKKQAKQQDFYYLGNKYQIVMLNTTKKVSIVENTIFTKDETMLKKWYQKEIVSVFQNRLEYCKQNIKEKMPLTIHLKIRTMGCM